MPIPTKLAVLLFRSQKTRVGAKRLQLMEMLLEWWCFLIGDVADLFPTIVDPFCGM